MIENYWFQPEGSWARMGLTPDEVERVGGSWLALELPPPGALFRAGDTFAFLTTATATHDLRTPRAFRVVQANRRASENAELARLSPTGEGWLLEVELLPNSAIC